MIEAGLITVRWLHFAAVMGLFGLALFPLYSFPRGSELPLRFSRWLPVWLRRAGWLGLLSWLAVGWFTLANMTGSASAALDLDSLASVLLETSFGQVWVARLVLAAVLVALIGGPARSANHRNWTIVFLTALLLLSLAFVGHTQTNEGTLRAIHVGADAAHLLAAGAWLGGLLALGYLLMLARRFPSQEHTADAATALMRFSGMGTVAVTVLLSSGLANALFLVDSFAKLATTPYGQLLLLKLSLLVGMLALAAQNRFHLVPMLIKSKGGDHASASPLQLLRRNVIGEQVLGLGVVLIVGWLGILQPAITT